MKKYLLFGLTLSLLLPSVVFAASDENITKRRPDKPEQAQVQEIRQERIENRQERRSDIAANHANRLEKRFTSYFTRLNNIIARFQARLDLLKKDGKDTTQTQTQLDAVKTKLLEAKTKGGAAVAAFKAVDPAKFSEQKTEVLAARDQAVAARKLFVETHNLLKEALKSLKTISKPALPANQEAL